MKRIVFSWSVALLLGLVTTVMPVAAEDTKQSEVVNPTSGSVAVDNTPPSAAVNTSGSGCSDRLLTFPAWYRGLLDDNCDVKAPEKTQNGLSGFIWKIVLNLVEILLQLVGYVALGYLIWGGYQYILSRGESSNMVAAKQTITNAVIGLVISIASIAIVNIVTGAL